MKYSIRKSDNSSVLFTHEDGIKAYRSTPVEIEFWARIQKLEIALNEIAFGVRRPSKRPSGGVQIGLRKEDMQKIAEEALKKD